MIPKEVSLKKCRTSFFFDKSISNKKKTSPGDPGVFIYPGPPGNQTGFWFFQGSMFLSTIPHLHVEWWRPRACFLQAGSGSIIFLDPPNAKQTMSLWEKTQEIDPLPVCLNNTLTTPPVRTITPSLKENPHDQYLTKAFQKPLRVLLWLHFQVLQTKFMSRLPYRREYLRGKCCGQRAERMSKGSNEVVFILGKTRMMHVGYNWGFQNHSDNPLVVAINFFCWYLQMNKIGFLQQ